MLFLFTMLHSIEEAPSEVGRLDRPARTTILTACNGGSMQLRYITDYKQRCTYE